jgi:hypothetical protein
MPLSTVHLHLRSYEYKQSANLDCWCRGVLSVRVLARLALVLMVLVLWETCITSIRTACHAEFYAVFALIRAETRMHP